MWPLTESLIRQKLVAQRRQGYEKMQTQLSGNSASRGKQTRLPHSGADWQYNHGRLPGGDVCPESQSIGDSAWVTCWGVGQARGVGVDWGRGLVFAEGSP